MTSTLCMGKHGDLQVFDQHGVLALNTTGFHCMECPDTMLCANITCTDWMAGHVWCCTKSEHVDQTCTVYSFDLY